MVFRSLGTLRDFLGDVEWPATLFSPENLPEFLDNIHVQDYETIHDDAGQSGTLWLALAKEIGLGLPGLGGIRLLAGSNTPSLTFLTLSYHAAERLTFQLHNTTLTLRIDPNLMRPMRKNNAGQFERDITRTYTQIDLGTVAISADTDGSFNFDRDLRFQLPHPVEIGDSGIIIDSGDLHLHLSGETKGIALRWTQAQMSEWLQRISPALTDQSNPADSQLTARLLLNDTGLQEVRVDWGMASPRTLSLPGVNVITPGDLLFTLILGGIGRSIKHAALIATLPASNEPIKLQSNFAWDRGGERELQNNRNQNTPDPFVAIELKNSELMSLALLDIDLSLDRLPGFFRETRTPLKPMDFDQSETLLEPTPVEFLGLQNHWTGELSINPDAFRMPFLEQGEANPLANQFQQWFEIKPRQTNYVIDFDAEELSLLFTATVKFGTLELAGDVSFGFNWETMSLSVNHENGFAISSPEPVYQPEKPHLGLYWTLRGAPQQANNGPYDYFRVVTKDYNYQIQMVKGASFELEYRDISDEPIGFLITDFVLSPKGIDLAAEVSDRPARLNGIDTRFRFSGSRLEIKENTIKDLTLAGSGPLPPDLVGEAMVDIALQFKQMSGSLTLVAGSAQLQGNKLLDCKGTRFQFALDAIGLKFVFENKFHLFFTLTGSAQFVLASGDDSEGALALLPKLKIDMVECPLCGDVKVLAKHVKFLIDLPKPLKFSFLKAFEFELRGFGFLPQAEVLGGIGAMQLSGQIFFSQDGGDVLEAKIDFHNLYIGLPRRGEFFPQIHFKRIAVKLKVGEAFELIGAVEFYDDATMKGFAGEGMVDLKGMPQLAAAFSFVRVRRDENSNWVRAWFIYLEVRKVSFMIPVIQIYIREIGLGFGYRYTIASIKAVDRENDIRKLRAELVKLSRTQAELAKINSWAVDLEDPGQDPRWTIVFRAMIAQNSASPGVLQYSDEAEKELANLFLLDAMIAFRSDLTFYMTVRGWLNTNYHEFVNNIENVRERPLYSGFVLLSPRRKMFMMAVASNPDGYIGNHPVLPDFVKEAIRSVTFSATLLITPGLFHFELGWPNKLSWKLDLGILKVECRGGFIFRITPQEIVMGISYEARGRLEIRAELDLGVIGVWVGAVVEVAFGARVIALLPFNNALGAVVYGAIGLELMIRLEFGFWIKISLGFCKIKIKFRFSMEIGFTAGVEIAIGIPPQVNVGARGQGTLWIAVMGHRLQVSANLSFRGDFVESAAIKTKHVLDLGLEATDSTDLPGMRAAAPMSMVAFMMADEPQGDAYTFHLPGYSAVVLRNRQSSGWSCFVLFPRGEYWEGEEVLFEQGFLPPPPLTLALNLENGWIEGLNAGTAPADVTVALADRGIKLVEPALQAVGSEWRLTGLDQQAISREFHLRYLPSVNQLQLTQKVESDFTLTLPGSDGVQFMQYDPITQSWVTRKSGEQFSWAARWQAAAYTGQLYPNDDAADVEEAPQTFEMSLADYLTQAYRTEPISSPPSLAGQIIPVGDPETKLFATTHQVQEDGRVYNPSDDAFEEAVRGAAEQFAGSPFLRMDPSHPYDQLLQKAFQSDTTVYHASGKLLNETDRQVAGQNQTAMQARGMVVQDIVADLRAYAEYLFGLSTDEQRGDTPPMPPKALDPASSIPFNIGLVFAYKGQTPTWLDSFEEENEPLPEIQQRLSLTASRPDGSLTSKIETFNLARYDFARNPPEFNRIQHFTSSNSIAITWDLTWTWSRNQEKTETSRDDPNHHLLHYEVRRRSLNGREREVLYTVKPAEALHREENTGDELRPLRRLKPRFNIVDNFNHETAEEQATIPPEGLSYLYTITPVDFNGSRGRPLSLVATRYANRPPHVTANARLVITYDQATLPKPGPVDKGAIHEATGTNLQPVVIQPREIELRGWEENSTAQGGPREPAYRYFLLFRREQTLPIGSYGLDAATAVERMASRPVTNARALATDVRVEVTGIQNDPAAIIARLQEANVLPATEWRPEAWTVFIQTESLQGVRSALVPVELVMKIAGERSNGVHTEPISDERQLAMLEWLAEPLHLPYLPPEDQTARTGPAHFPMPKTDSPFDGSLAGIAYQSHPAGIRAIRFRWNQAPSASPDYPLNLNAGYHLYQLNVDAHTDAVLDNPTKLAGALTRLQEVQMIPAEDLPFVPGDTLAVNQWEAWYPSAVKRENEAITVQTSSGEQSTRSSWYSWRESQLVWPECPGNFVAEVNDSTGRRRFSRLLSSHPILNGIVAALREAYLVDLQLYPPDMPGDLEAMMRVTSPKNDTYGWGVLQRFGLSITLALRYKKNGKSLLGEELLDAVGEYIRDKAIVPEAMRKHLTVEVLFQPSQATSLNQGPVSASAMLAIVQVSLRPLVRQSQFYRKIKISGAPGSTVTVGLLIKAGTVVSLRNLSQEDAGQMEIVPEDPPKDKFWKQQFKLSLIGSLELALRSDQPPNPFVQLTAEQNLRVLPMQADLAHLGVDYKVDEGDTAWYLVLNRTIVGDAAVELRNMLAPDLGSLADRLLATQIESISPMAPEVEGFGVSDEMIKRLSDDGDKAIDWITFRKYAESLSGSEAPTITVPSSGDNLKEFLPRYMEWSSRFFDHSGIVRQGEDGVYQTGDGPWMATAYPRVTTPSYAAPDEGGRLKYDHLIEDKWAHNYRHFILPYGRYDLLWQTIWQSPTFIKSGDVSPQSTTDTNGNAPIPQQRRLPVVLPEGGLDVVLDRVRPVDRPLILRSGRLDRMAMPGQPMPPGATWEVIVAKHTEQAIIERNQTLARQVSFRQVSFTLLRRFAYPSWPRALEKMVRDSGDDGQFTIEVQPVESYPSYEAAELPSDYPAQPDHLVFDNEIALAEHDGLSLDLPQRLGSFQQGALVLQWQSLPFYYHHKLLVVAQSTSTVSPVNEVIQRDFEYISPPPVPDATMALLFHDQLIRHILQIRIPLNTLWESLPPEAQKLWQSEMPDETITENTRKYSALPDPEVVYQIVETFNGNIEVQVEYLYEEKRTNGVLEQAYNRRQLGKNLIDNSQMGSPALEHSQGRFFLVTHLRNQITGTFSPVEEVVWDKPDPGSPLVNTFRWPEADRWLLVWEGLVDDRQQADLLTLPGDLAFRAGIQELITLAAAASLETIIRVPVSLPPDLRPGELPIVYQLKKDEQARRYTGLTRLGAPLPEDEEIALLRRWAARTPELVAAAEALLRKIDTETFVKVDIPPDNIAQEDLPTLLQKKMKVDGRFISWLGDEQPDDGEAEAILAIRASQNAEQTLRKLIELGADAVNATLEMEAAARFPRRSALPHSLQDHLLVTPVAITWRGGKPTNEQAEELNRLIDEILFGDEFAAQLIDLLDRIVQDARELVSIPLDIAMRPEQDDLPESLTAQLLLGRLPLIIDNPLTSQMAIEVAGIFLHAPEKASIYRMATESLRRILHGRTLELRTRRGSAMPSNRIPIAARAPGE